MGGGSSIGASGPGRAVSRMFSQRGARLLGVARVFAGVALFTLVILAAAREWSEVRDTLSRISPIDLALTELLALLGLAASALTWRRALSELGFPLRVAPASKIYLIGQLGKYVPGSLWAFVVQMELGRKVGVPRLSSIAAGAVAIAVNLVVGLSLGIFAVPTVANGQVWRYAALSALFLTAAVALVPPVQRWALGRIGRHKEDAVWGDRHVSWSGGAAAMGWSIVSWGCYGLALWILVTASGGPAWQSLWLSGAGLALAMTAGFVIFVAPAGIGVREAMLVAALAPILESGRALGVALVLRLAFTLADLVAAALTVPVRLVPERGAIDSGDLATEERA